MHLNATSTKLLTVKFHGLTLSFYTYYKILQSFYDEETLIIKSHEGWSRKRIKLQKTIIDLIKKKTPKKEDMDLNFASDIYSVMHNKQNKTKWWMLEQLQGLCPPG